MRDEAEEKTIKETTENPFKEITVLSSEAYVYCIGDARSKHPRIFLDLTKTGIAICPYCSSKYAIKK